MKNLSTKSTHKLVVVMILLSFLNFNCSSDDDSNQEELVQIIELIYQDVAPEAFLQNLADCGFPLEEGNEPPIGIINGFYTHQNIGGCNNANEAEGTNFTDTQCNYLNFSPTEFTLNVECRGVTGTITTSNKAYLLGNGNNFTMYMSDIKTNSEGEQARFATIHSGTINPENMTITNYRSALLSVEIISGDNWLGEGKFRSFNTVDAIRLGTWGSEYE